MRDKPTVLKLGGSVVTRKDEPLTPNIDAINRLADEIFRADSKPLIVIHGGGSYGHPIAKKYCIRGGFKDETQLFGFSETHQAMISLNSLLTEAFLKHGIPAFSISPSSFIITSKGRIRGLNLKVLKSALTFGMVPILYGDAVFDDKLGFTILSGDQIAATLAVKLKAERIIMGVDVDGLYDSDPKINPSAHLIPELSLKEYANVIRQVGESISPDVTGGMLGKILELRVAVENRIEVLIVNALKPDNIYRALRGEEVVGTRIRA